MQRLVVIVLGGLSLVLGCVIVTEALDAGDVPLVAQEMPRVAILRPRAAETIVDRPIQVAGLLARPLFSRTRRPPVQAEAGVVEANVMPRLSGIIISPTRRLAIFAPKGSKPIVTREGSRVGRFTIRTICPNWVAVVGPDGSQILRTAFSTVPNERAASPSTSATAHPILLHLPPGVFTIKGGINLNTTHPDRPSAAIWSGPPRRLPAASAPLLKPPASPSASGLFTPLN